jgi:RNA polymerase sigma-70 factor (ECF subfamily)
MPATMPGALPESSIDDQSDEALVAAVNDSDPEAFEALYRRHRDWVVNLAFRYTRDQHSALDVLQETFLYLLRKFPGFELTCQLRSFLYPVVRHLALGARRKAERCQSDGTDPQDWAVAVNLSAVEPQARRDLAAALVSLSEDHREVLLLRFVDGMSLGEIAEAMDVPLGTVKSRLHHALEQLREDPRTRELLEP